MSLVPYIQFGERVVGENSPLYTDVANRPLKYIIDQSGLDDTQDFLGFASGSVGTGDPEGSVLGRVGDIYGDRNATSAVIWTKTSGNNTNVGWKMLLWNSAGTVGTIPKFGSGGSLVNSLIVESGSLITISASLTVTGSTILGDDATTDTVTVNGLTTINSLGNVNALTISSGRLSFGVGANSAYDAAGSAPLMFVTNSAFPAPFNTAGNLIFQSRPTASRAIVFATFDGSANSWRWQISGAGHLLPVDVSYNIGAATNAILTVFTQNIDSGSATDLLLKRNAVTQLTLASSLATFVGDVAIGTGTVATTGRIRLANNSTGIQFRNAANNANIPALVVDNSNRVIIDSGTGGGIILRNVGFPYLTFSGATATFASSIGVILDNTGGYLQLGTSGVAGALGRIRAKYNDVIISGTLNSGTGATAVLQYGGSGFTDITLIGGLKGTYLSAGSAGSTGGWYFDDTGAMSSSTNTVTLGAGSIGYSFGRATISVTGTYPSYVSGPTGEVTALTLSATGGLNTPTAFALNVITGDIVIYLNRYRFPSVLGGSSAGKVLTISSWSGLTSDPIFLDWSYISTSSLAGYGAAGGYLRSDGSAWIRVQTLTPGVTNTEDIGATGNVWRTLYSPIHDSGSATDLLFKRNAVTQLTIGSLTALFAGAAAVTSTLSVGTNFVVGQTSVPSADEAIRISSLGVSVGTTAYGIRVDFPYLSTVTNEGRTVYIAFRTTAAAFTMTNGFGLYINTPSLGAGSTVTTGHGIFLASQTWTGSTTAYGIRMGNVTGATTNYSIQTGSSTTGAGWHQFGDIVGIGVTVNQNHLLAIWGLASGSGPNTHPGTATIINGLTVSYGIPTTATVSAVYLQYQARTLVSAYTVGTLIGFYAQSPSIGAGSTITTSYAIRVDNQGNAAITSSYGLLINSQSGSAINNFAIFTGLGLVSFGDTVQVASIIRTGSATDLILQRNSVTQLTLGSLLATFSGDVDLASGKVYKVNTTQVVKARITGYTNLMTGTANRATAYDTSTITLVQLAERVKALEDDLHATAGHGLIGA